MIVKLYSTIIVYFNFLKYQYTKKQYIEPHIVYKNMNYPEINCILFNHLNNKFINDLVLK